MQVASSFAVHPPPMWTLPLKVRKPLCHCFRDGWWFITICNGMFDVCKSFSCSDCTLPYSKAMETIEYCWITFYFASGILAQKWYVHLVVELFLDVCASTSCFSIHYYTVLLSCVLIILHALCSGIFQLFSVGHFFTCLQQGACSFDSLVLWVFSVPSWQTFVWVVTLYSGLVIRLYVKVEKERNSISFSWRSWNVLYRD